MGDNEVVSALADLETKIAFLEANNDQLEQALLLQHKRLEHTEAVVNELRNRLTQQAALIEEMAGEGDEAPPPHY